MNLQFNPGGAFPVFTLDDRPAAALTAANGTLIGLYQERRPVFLALKEFRAGNVVVYENESWTVTDTLEFSGGGAVTCRRVWRNRTAAPLSAALVFELYRPAPVEHYCIPAVNYDGNFWGDGQEPKGLVDPQGQDFPFWVYGGDRSSIPACTITASAHGVAGLYAPEAEAAQSACALRPDGEDIVQQVWWPLQELPRSYARRDTYAPGIYQELSVGAGESCAREVFLSIHPAAGGAGAYHPVAAEAWRRFFTRVPAPYPPQRLWDLGMQFARDSLWREDEHYTGFVLGRMLHEGQWIEPSWNLAEIAWCGQNGTLACMMLEDFLRTGSEDSWRRGAAALDDWARQCALPNGLIYTHIDDVLAGRTLVQLETCNLGGGAYAYLLAAELAQRAGRPQPLWLKTGLGICDFFTRSILPDGRFGRYWCSDGSLIEAEGTVGSWMIWPLLKAYRMTGLPIYLETARRAFRYYTENDLARFCITAGALDTDCIDKEGAFPLLVSGLDLYEITGEASYLAQAERAAEYLATWQWHYTLAYPSGTAAEVIGYQTFGGTSVSVQHHHLDPWGVLIALGWLRLARHTGNSEWAERGAAAWRQGAYGVSDGSLTINGMARLAGGQDEGFYHTRWGGAPGGVSNWLVAWPTAFRLFLLQQWPDWAALD